MEQIDAFLKRVSSEQDISFVEDIYGLYSFVPNDDLRKLMASYHTQLNKWFSVIN